MDHEELTPQNLFRYLRYVQLAATLESEKAAEGTAGEDQEDQQALRQGAAMLATEIMRRYRLGPRPEDN